MERGPGYTGLFYFMQAYYYSFALDKNIQFESIIPHCPSCLDDEDEGYRSIFDLGCCCKHQDEGNPENL